MNKFTKHKLSNIHSNKIGDGTILWQYVIVLKEAKIGENCNINAHVFIENDVVIGNNVTIKSGVQIWDGIELEDNVFIGPNVTFTNDMYPRSKKYPIKFDKTLIKKGVSIGGNATILSSLVIEENAMIGAGSVLTKNVGRYEVWYGSPAKHQGYCTEDGVILDLDLWDKRNDEYYFWNGNKLVNGRLRKKVIDKIFPLEKYGCSYRLVDLEDAEFILSLRTDKELGKFINVTSPSIEDQTEWLKKYKVRESKGQDFYFLCSSVDGKIKYGLNRIYDIKSNEFEFGSWLYSTDAPKDKAVLSDLFCHSIAFEELNIEKCNMSVRIGNRRVINYTKSYNPTFLYKDEKSMYFEYSYLTWNRRRNVLLKILGYDK